MNSKILKWKILRGSLARRLLLKTVLFALAMAAISFTQIVHDVETMEPLAMNFDKCSLDFNSDWHLNHTGFAFPFIISSPWARCDETENVTINVYKELMEKGLLDSDSKALCVGEASASAVGALQKLGVSNAFGVHRHPFFSLARKRFVYELNFKDNHFDFVFSRALDRVSIPALLVLEIERVLRPGGTGAMLVGASSFYSAGLIRSAFPVSSFLRSSEIMHVCGIGSFTLVVFKKRIDTVALLEHYQLPKECPSVSNNEPFIPYMEPLEDETKVAYLPKFMDISSRKRLVYISINAGEFVTSGIAQKLKLLYPIKPHAFNAYVIDHNASALSSYVKEPGITFVYHPGLAGDRALASLSPDEFFSAPSDEEEFDFIRWFKETVSEGDFVILIMNAKVVELKILFELFESGAICKVDELFIHCSAGEDCGSAMCRDCTSLFRGLRNSGVFAHRWLRN